MPSSEGKSWCFHLPLEYFSCWRNSQGAVSGKEVSAFLSVFSPVTAFKKSKIVNKKVATTLPPPSWKINCRMPEGSSEIQMLYVKMNGKDDGLPFTLLVWHQGSCDGFYHNIYWKEMLFTNWKKKTKPNHSQIVFFFYNSTSCRWQHSLYNVAEHTCSQQLSSWQSNEIII